MPVEKITLTHRFGIISSTYKEKLAKNLQEKGQDTDRSSSSNTSDGHKYEYKRMLPAFRFMSSRKHLLLGVTEEFVQEYNRATPGERIKKNDTIYRMLQRLKVREPTLLSNGLHYWSIE